jgi:DNA-binding LacI/PurR family transcriptional regulator
MAKPERRSAGHRLEGFRDAAADLGLDWSTVPVAVCAVNDAGTAEAAARELLGDGCDAIATMSDQQALGVLRAAERLGRRVPDAVAITGWDDSRTASEHDLTSVAQSLRAQGRACAVAALGGNPRRGAFDEWSVVVRGSTRA